MGAAVISLAEVRLPSEFDYATQAVLYLPQRMPDPRAESFAAAAGREVIEILKRTRGRAFVLFTSYASMRAVHGGADVAQFFRAQAGHGIHVHRRGGSRFLADVLDHPRAAPVGTNPVDAPVPGDAEHPTQRRAQHRVKQAGPLPDLHERFLHHLFRVVRTA